MENWVEHINYEKMSQAMAEYVREKAKKAGIDIVYREGENIVAENPVTGEKKILKKSSRKLHL